MKKLYALAALMVLAFGAHAQRGFKPATIISTPTGIVGTANRTVVSPNHSTALVMDTLFPPYIEQNANDPYCDTITGYFTDLGSGFFSGNNPFGDREKLMKYKFAGTGTVKRLFASVFKWTTSGTGTTPVYGVVYGCGLDGKPDSTTRVLSTAVTMARLTNSGTFANRFVFANAAIFADSFYVGIVLPQHDGDTLLIRQSRLPESAAHPTDCGSTDTAGWERAADGSFNRVFDAWGWNFEMQILAEIQYDNAQAVNSHLAQLVHVSPVPANNTVMVSIPSDFSHSTNWQLFSVEGRMVSQSAGSVNASQFTVNRNNLPGGVYTLRLNTSRGPVNKRIIFSN